MKREMASERVQKPLCWIGSALDDLREFPEQVRAIFGYALFVAQCGGKHRQAKVLKGFGGSGVLEVMGSY